MIPAPRHQCLVYSGPPSRHLPALAATIKDKLAQNYRCLYLNSPPMVAGMQSYLAAQGVDVAGEMARSALILSAERNLENGDFDTERMLEGLKQTLHQTLIDGFQSLWASGDMAWEFGSEKNYFKLLDYEWRLEKFLQENPAMGGVCQYHSDILPVGVMREALIAHPALFVNQTLSLLNTHYIQPEVFSDRALQNPELDRALRRLADVETVN
jgi:MEDS: MEthanogen/methylotroph, DcmR Sensory domain